MPFAALICRTFNAARLGFCGMILRIVPLIFIRIKGDVL